MPVRVSDLVQIGLPQRQAALLGDTTEDSIAATGTTQGTARKLTATLNRITSITAGVNEAVLLPPIAQATSSIIWVRNDAGGPTLSVFPSSGESINSAAVNTAGTVATSIARPFFIVSASRWATT